MNEEDTHTFVEESILELQQSKKKIMADVLQDERICNEIQLENNITFDTFSKTFAV